MLVIPTYVERSEIEGLGLFTAQEIKKGDLVWYLDPSIDQVFYEDEFDKLLKSQSEEQADRFKKWAYKRRYTYILCADNAKFFNHSDIPNCDDPNDLFTLANRNIKIGEELTCNYRDIDDPSNTIKSKLY